MNMTGISHFASTLADAARSIVLPHFRQSLPVEHKADHSPVTRADREAEQRLRELIHQSYPEHGIVGEEYADEGRERRYRWVLDPIDGTKSFISGMPTFGALIALLDRNTPLLGLIDMPALNERWLGLASGVTTLNGRRCQTRAAEQLSEAILFATAPDMFCGDAQRSFQRLATAVQLQRFGADCYAYGLLATGYIDLVAEADLKPYDFMALIPIIEGADGVISDWQGQALSLESDGQVLAAATPALHQQALKVLNAESAVE